VLFLKISNLCDQNTSTSRTDGLTDRRLAVYYSVLRSIAR